MSDTVVFAREPFAALASPGSQPDAANAAVLKVVGELDLDGVPEVDHELRRAEARATLVVVDLRELEFIDTSSACLLLETHNGGFSALADQCSSFAAPPRSSGSSLSSASIVRLELVDCPRIEHSAPFEEVVA